jgi:hypothetical protein
MSVTRSSLSSWKARLTACSPFFTAASQNSSTRAHHGRGIAPAMGHAQNNLTSAGWNGAAMLFGTLAWMGVYYAKDLFAEIDDDGAASYVLHSLVMGVVANLAVYPFVKLTHLARGEDSAQANAEFRKYFILCTIPDALYEPTADWLSSMATSDSITEFEFVKYAQPTFNVKEAAGAFAFFGVVFGMIYYFGDKCIQYLAPDEPDVAAVPLERDATCTHKSLRVCWRMFESDEGIAVMAALQYFIFYLTDDLFDVDWESFHVTFPQVLGMAGLMAAYTFAVDALPVLLQALENKYYPTAEENTEGRTIEEDFRELYNDNSSLSEKLLPADATDQQVSRSPRSSLFRAAPASPSQSLVFSSATYHRV